MQGKSELNHIVGGFLDVSVYSTRGGGACLLGCVISDLTRHLQIDEITTHTPDIDGGSRTMWACCK